MLRKENKEQRTKNKEQNDMEEKLTYKEAMEQLEQLVKVIEDPEHPLDQIQTEIEKAMELVKYCREELAGTAEKLNGILEQK